MSEETFAHEMYQTMHNPGAAIVRRLRKPKRTRSADRSIADDRRSPDPTRPAYAHDCRNWRPADPFGKPGWPGPGRGFGRFRQHLRTSRHAGHPGRAGSANSRACSRAIDLLVAYLPAAKHATITVRVAGGKRGPDWRGGFGVLHHYAQQRRA